MGLFIKRQDPYVAEANTVSMVLKHQGTLRNDVIGDAARGVAVQDDIVVYGQSILKNRHTSVLDDGIILIVTGARRMIS